jgi:hypothetical protein
MVHDCGVLAGAVQFNVFVYLPTSSADQIISTDNMNDNIVIVLK